ncbi:MAG TPA: sugar porter family MFS transporter [Luteolibacter sp.]|nr:sugar porter family MFS transporter [Luteolibacter sp.]
MSDGKSYLVLSCGVATLGGLLFGYDTAVISGAIEPLREWFGLNATMKGWAAGCALVGCVAGVIMAGPINDRFGRKITLLLAAVLFLVSALGTALPRTFTEFVIYRIVGGLGVGIASMTSPMYIAEISPARLRGRMVSLNQFSIIFGMLLVYFVNYHISGLGDEGWMKTTGWRWMFGSEAVPALVLLAALFFVPESPRFLCRKGRTDQARAILARIDGEDHAGREIAEIETALRQESGDFRELLRPGLRGVLILGIALAVLQQVTGINVFLYYAPDIFRSVAGTGTDIALLQTVVVGAVNLLFTAIAILTVDRIGRRPLMIAGAAGMGISLIAIGAASSAQAVGGWLLLFVLGYIASFALSVGPVTWVILSEIFPTKLRGRALGIATFFLWTANFIVSQTFPMLDENRWLVERFHHGFPFFVYAAFCVVLVWVVMRFVPETKGRSLEQIERSWHR